MITSTHADAAPTPTSLNRWSRSIARDFVRESLFNKLFLSDDIPNYMVNLSNVNPEPEKDQG